VVALRVVVVVTWGRSCVVGGGGDVAVLSVGCVVVGGGIPSLVDTSSGVFLSLGPCCRTEN
jgi:hypothetical protein